MALSDPRLVFGVHSAALYNRTTALPYGILRVIGGSQLSLTGELVKLTGGASKYPWGVEDGLITAELSLAIREYPDFLFEIFLGKAPTASSADTTGTVSTLTDKFGTTVADASTGIASVIVIPSTGAADLKFGKYVAKAISDDDIEIYTYSDIDFARGTDETFDSDALLVATAAIGDAGATTDVASLGLRFTAGSGTTAFTTGHTATFEVKPPSTKSTAVTVGATSDVFPEFGAVVLAKKRGNLEMTEFDLFRCKAVGMPFGLQQNAWSEGEVKAEVFQDSTQNGIFKFRHITPSD